MALHPTKFGSPTMEGGSILIHGIFNAGKTKLGAAAMKYFSKHGRVSFFSFDEEDGYSSAAGMGLEKEDLGYQCLYHGNTIDEFCEWLTLVEKEKPLAICTDSLWALYRAIQKKKTGGERPPMAGKSDKNEWPSIHNDAYNIMTRHRKAATWCLMLCPSDTGQNVIKETETEGLVKKVKVTPDLNGKMAEGCIAWFNLVGYMMLDEIKDVKGVRIKRTLSFLPSTSYVTRQRMPYPITELITIPDGDPEAGWEKLMNLANASYAKAYKENQSG